MIPRHPVVRRTASRRRIAIRLIAARTLSAPCSPAATATPDHVSGDFWPTITASAIRSASGKAIMISRCSSAATAAACTPAQRAEVLVLRRRPGVARRPAASLSKCRRARRTSAAAKAMREIRSLFWPPRRAEQRGSRCGPIGRPTDEFADDQAQLSEMIGAGRSVRTVAARPRPDRRSELQRERAVLESGLRHPAQLRRHGRQSGRPGSAARRDAVLHRPPHGRARQVPPRRKPIHAPIRSEVDKGKISDLGK